MPSKSDSAVELVVVKSSPPLPVLSKEDNHYLERREQIVSEGIKASMTAARALYEIFNYKGGLLWQSKGFKGFSEYCFAQWGYERAHAFRLRECGEFVHELAEAPGHSAATPLPTHESQVRQVLLLPKDERVRFWREITKVSPPEALTAQAVRVEATAYSEAKKIKLVGRKRLSGRQRLKTAVGAVSRASRYVPLAKRDAWTALVKKLEALL